MTGQARLFSESNQPAGGTVVPLAARMRPRTLDEILGQEHLLAPGRAWAQGVTQPITGLPTTPVQTSGIASMGEAPAPPEGLRPA